MTIVDLTLIKPVIVDRTTIKLNNSAQNKNGMERFTPLGTQLFVINNHKVNNKQ